MGHRHKDHRKQPLEKATVKSVEKVKQPLATKPVEKHLVEAKSPAPKKQPLVDTLEAEKDELPPKSYLEELYQNVFEPGVNKAMQVFIHVTFACLFASLVFMNHLTGWVDIHVWILTASAGLCYGTLCWFIREMHRLEGLKNNKKKQD